jgi:hypothetical protein
MSLLDYFRSRTPQEPTLNDREQFIQLRNDVAELREEVDKYLERERRRSARERMAAKRAIEEVPAQLEAPLEVRRGNGGLLRRG